MQEHRPSAFGEYLKALRAQRRLSVSVLAEQSGIGAARLMALESGAGTPNRRELARLARAFRVSLESLLEKAGHVRMILD